VGLEAFPRPTLEKIRELSELQTQGKLHPSHGHITFPASEAAQCRDFTGQTGVDDHIRVAQHRVIKEVVIFPADLKKSSLVVEW
jgi:hypothetical protein